MLLPFQKILEKCINSRLATSCILTGSLAITTAALAEYKPPADQKPPTSQTTSTVARSGGCQGNSSTTLTALAPYSHVGQTSLPHPTLAWFVPDSQPYPIKFRLYGYAPSGDRPLIRTIDFLGEALIATDGTTPPAVQLMLLEDLARIEERELASDSIQSDRFRKIIGANSS